MELLRRCEVLMSLLVICVVDSNQAETTFELNVTAIITESTGGEPSTLATTTSTLGSTVNATHELSVSENNTSAPASTVREGDSSSETTPELQNTEDFISNVFDANKDNDPRPSFLSDGTLSKLNSVISLWYDVMKYLGNDTRTQGWTNVASALWLEMVMSEWNGVLLEKWNNNMTSLWEEIVSTLEGEPFILELNHTMVTLWNEFVGSHLNSIFTSNGIPEDFDWLPPLTNPNFESTYISDWGPLGNPLWGPTEVWPGWGSPEENSVWGSPGDWSGWATPEGNSGMMPPKGGFGWVPSYEDQRRKPSEQNQGRMPIKGGFGWVPSKEDREWVPSKENPGWVPSDPYSILDGDYNSTTNNSSLKRPEMLHPNDEEIKATISSFPEQSWEYPYEEENDTVEVSLQQGTILGKRERTGIGGRYFYSFRGIPFAEPPVGRLRFKDPVPASSWNGTRNVTSDPPKCPQLQYYITVGEEDCLYLNVYTTQFNSSDLPVMVWIHGGSFVAGGADEYPPLPFMNKDIVLVTIQYRLGTLGFLSTEDSVMPGNLGLKDQTLALHWVKDNIRDLGGDPNKVTIFGQSSGAASVHLQVISPRARGLFKRVIMQSGSALSQWAIRTDHRKIAIAVGKEFNCSSGEDPSFNSSILLQCLQDLPLSDVVGIPSLFTMLVSLPTVMTPRVDGDFLPDHPAALLKQGIYNKVDVMVGVNKHDGATIALPFLLNPWLVNELMINFEVAAPALMYLEKENSPLQLASQILEFYLQGYPISMAVADEFIQMMSDLAYKFDHDEVTKIHAGDYDLGLKAYSYEFQYRGQYSFSDLYGPDAGIRWVTLADELPYLFNSRLTILRQLDDLIIRDMMVDLWTNFAKTGDPTPDNSHAFQWLPVTPNCLRYLAIDRLPYMKRYDRAMVMDFWRKLDLQTNSYLNPPHKWQSILHKPPEPVQDCWG